jgi:hypothetical protein
MPFASVGHGDDLVAGADALGQQRQVQRAGAAVDADGVTSTAERGEVLLERGDRGAEDELGAVEHLEHRGIDLGLEGAVLRLEVDERNHARTVPVSETRRP